MTTALVIPFRDRGIDPCRPLNLEFVSRWWTRSGIPWPLYVVSDGRVGNSPFNRSAAYNLAIADHPEVDVFVFIESDVFCGSDQIANGIELAQRAPGLVVGFSRFLEVSESDSVKVRAGDIDVTEAEVKQIRDDYGSNGAVNIVSRRALDMVGGYDESFSAAWWDDSAMKIAFDICCGPTRFVEGDLFHLFHKSGGRPGAVTTQEDRAATQRNKERWLKYKRATTPRQIRRLTRGEG